MKKLVSKLGAWASVLPVLLLPAAASAQISAANTTLSEVGSAMGEESTGTDLPTLIGSLINVFLSVLGIIFVVLVVFAGYTWMMAGGDTDKVKKAKQMIANGVIGIVITVAAYAISSFVINSISNSV